MGNIGGTGASVDGDLELHGTDDATDWFVNLARSWFLLWEMGSAPF